MIKYLDRNDCPACDGTGMSWGETCVRCGGSGQIEPEDEVKESG